MKLFRAVDELGNLFAQYVWPWSTSSCPLGLGDEDDLQLKETRGSQESSEFGDPKNWGNPLHPKATEEKIVNHDRFFTSLVGGYIIMKDGSKKVHWYIMGLGNYKNILLACSLNSKNWTLVKVKQQWQTDSGTYFHTVTVTNMPTLLSHLRDHQVV